MTDPVVFIINAEGNAAEVAEEVSDKLGGLGKQGEKTGGSMMTMGSMITTANQALELGKKVIGAFTDGLELADKLVIDVARDTAMLADSVAKVSKAYSIGTRDLQAFRSAAGMSGIEAGQADRAFFMLGKTIFDASRGLKSATELFDMAGINIHGMNGKLKQAPEVIKELAHNIESGLIPAEEQAALASNLLRDRTGKMLILLRSGTGQIDQAVERLTVYGAMMSGPLLTASEAYVDSLQRRKEAEQGWKTAISEGTIPTMAALNDVIAATMGSQGVLRQQVADLAGKVFPWLAHALIDTTDYVSRLALTFKIMFHDVYGGLLEMREQFYRTISDMAGGARDLMRMVGMDDLANSYDVFSQKTGLIANAQDKLGEAQEAAIARTMRQKAAVSEWADEAHRAFENQLQLYRLAGGAGAGAGGEGGRPPGGDGTGAGTAGAAGAGSDFSADWWVTETDISGEWAKKAGDSTTAMADSMVADYDRIGEAIGSAFGELATAEDKTAATTAVFKRLGQTVVEELGSMAAAAITGAAATSTSQIAANTAQTASATGTAVVQAAADRGQSAAQGMAVLGAAVAGGAALVGSLIAAIGDEGIQPGMLRGRKTVLLENDETVVARDPSAGLRRMVNYFERRIAQQGDARTGGGDVMDGGGSVHVTAPIYLDGERIATATGKAARRQARSGNGIWSMEAFAY